MKPVLQLLGGYFQYHFWPNNRINSDLRRDAAQPGYAER